MQRLVAVPRLYNWGPKLGIPLWRSLEYKSLGSIYIGVLLCRETAIRISQSVTSACFFGSGALLVKDLAGQ